MNKTTLTFGYYHCIEPGMTISMSEPDNRWWKKLFHKCLFMRPPMKKVFYKVTDKPSGTTLTIEKVSP